MNHTTIGVGSAGRVHTRKLAEAGTDERIEAGSGQTVIPLPIVDEIVPEVVNPIHAFDRLVVVNPPLGVSVTIAIGLPKAAPNDYAGVVYSNGGPAKALAGVTHIIIAIRIYVVGHGFLSYGKSAVGRDEPAGTTLVDSAIGIGHVNPGRSNDPNHAVGIRVVHGGWNA